MAIPVYLQQFKAAGIYRVVFDKSTISNVDSQIMRLVVGYSEKGPFNIPVVIRNPQEFRLAFGDISKKLEKRGVFFHRTALQALSAGPILALNLKKFSGETVDGASINTAFNPAFAPIDTVKLAVEDIYDTSRFWELSASKLNDLKAVDGSVMDQYINISATDNKNNGASYFIRKASGTKLNGYNITVNDWYSDGAEEMPDYLEPFKNSLISDFFAEIYVFKGRFVASQVLASSTLKNYFEAVTDDHGKPVLDTETGEVVLKLRNHLTNAFGDSVDTLDSLYYDETSNAIGHYVGCLIPYFKNKQGFYQALDIIFNSDQDTHKLMMSFNVDALEEDGTASIDLSGRLSIPTDIALTVDKSVIPNGLSLPLLYAGTASTTLLGNSDAPVVSDKLTFSNNIITTNAQGVLEAFIPMSNAARKIMGTLYVSEISKESKTITVHQVGTKDTVNIVATSLDQLYAAAVKLHAAYIVGATDAYDYDAYDAETETHTYYALYENGYGTVWNENSADGSSTAFIELQGEDTNAKMVFTGVGPKEIITSITRIDRSSVGANAYDDSDMNMKVSFETVVDTTVSNYSGSEDNVYGSSVTFVPVSDSWESTVVDGSYALVSKYTSGEGLDSTLFSILQVGDCLLADDGSTDRDGNNVIDDKDSYYDNVYVQSLDTVTDEFGNIVKYVIKVTAEPLQYNDNIVRIDAGLNQEIGSMIPQFLNGYTYKNAAPAGTTMKNKLDWQKFILSALTEYKGLRTGLLNKSDIDYRYIIDTFESFVDEEVKSVLTYLAKEKQSAFAILNFPAVKTFVKCPYTSFTDDKGVFNVDYVVKGYNRKKAAGVRFSLPSDSNGASFGAFYTPLKYSDGYVDTIIPAAGIVSNLFIEKYNSRQPYYIIAGPNYGNISGTNIVGPDYNYSQDELQIIEPFGVNCMVYRPGFGTFINANQTAKQTPVSALSKVNVRELVIYLQDEIEKVLQAYQWEFNNATTRTAILDKANSICARIAANGGIQAYLNVMDESNNTPEIIDNEMAILSTHIEPGMGCGKMVQELTLYRTGQMSAIISD